MLGSDYGIPGSCRLKQIGPCIGFIFTQGKTLQLFHVISMADFLVVKTPRFINTVYGINTGMNEYAEFGIGKPLHLFFDVIGVNLFLCFCRKSQQYHTANTNAFLL